ncbi:MAG: STAS domain-containing protein [Bacteroidales bacterium]|jgi:ABC-type transporter Mla MlaB component|nr:STAS domain-containing protein [Bacteroidales bacterium]MDY0349176.1 STAS domain-containing protein [Tenuifilaceae bacterium]
MAKKQNITLKAKPSKVKGKSHEIELIAQGELTLTNAKKMKDFFINNLASGKHFNVRVSNVDSIDLGFIQILQRFYWDAQQENSKVTVSISLAEDHRVLLVRAGFESLITLNN